MSNGETDLDKLLQSMQPVLHEPVYVFITVSEDYAYQALAPLMVFKETEGVTLIAPIDAARSAGLKYEFRCRMITLNVHSALEAVGFLARITNALAAQNMGVNPVSAFYHDHLFVPENRAADAMRCLHAFNRQ